MTEPKSDLFHSYVACEFWCAQTRSLIAAELLFDPHGIKETHQQYTWTYDTKGHEWGSLYCRAVDEYEPIVNSEVLLTADTRIGKCTTSGGGLNTSLPPDRTISIKTQERRIVLVLPSVNSADDFLSDALQYLDVCIAQQTSGKKAACLKPYRLSLFNNRCRVTLFRKNGWRSVVWSCKNMRRLVLVRQAFLYFQPHRSRRGGVIYCCDIRQDLPPFQTPILETLLNVNDIKELCYGQHFPEFQTMAALDLSASQCFTLIQKDGTCVHASMSDEVSCVTLLKHLTDYYSEDLCQKIQV